MKIFILGNGRSGSSMLGMMLGAHPMINNIGEAYHLDKAFVSPAKKKIIKKEGLCGVCGKDCCYWNGADHTMPLPGIVVDTSKIVKWVSSFEEKDNKYIHIVRSVYDRLGSFKKEKGHINERIAMNWVKHENEVHKYLKNRSSYIIKYEDLCQKKGLWGICADLLGVPFQESMYEFWKELQHPVRGNSKTNLLLKLYHGFITEKDLNSKEKDFMDKIGFNIVYYDRTKFLSPSDMKLIRKCGCDEINRRNGY